MKSAVTAVAATVGVGAIITAAWTSGDARLVSTIVSLYGAFVVVVASYPGRRSVLALRRPRHI